MSVSPGASRSVSASATQSPAAGQAVQGGAPPGASSSVSASATQSPAAGQGVQGGAPPGASRSVSASATWSPAAGQARFSNSFGAVPNRERKQSQRLCRRLIGVHNPPQRRQRPSTTPHPAITNRPHSTLVPGPTLLFKGKPIVRLIMSNMVLRTLLKPSTEMSRARTGSRIILNESRNREPPLQTTSRNRIIEIRNRKLPLRATRNRIILNEPGNNKLPLQATHNSNIHLSTRNSQLPETG